MADDKPEINSLDAFVSTVSHDLRTPLSTIHLSASLMLQDSPTGPVGERLRARIAIIQRQVAAAQRLITTLLDAERINLGKLPIAKAEVDAAQDLLEVLDEFIPIAAYRNVLVDADIPIKPLHAIYDKDRIRQVLGNLVGNALKFAVEGSICYLRVCVDDTNPKMVRFEVTNVGEVIPSEKREIIFARFERAEYSHEYSTDMSTGLGLWIAKWIVEEHGGRIWVEPTSEGNKFCFTLPRRQ